ncbi:MAG TPA: membrane protein insertase YidC [Desulfurobacteriaceae bacterium]|nr:membrane protein insertase YidC [Desulfurobacteriaceae bacterium]
MNFFKSFLQGFLIALVVIFILNLFQKPSNNEKKIEKIESKQILVNSQISKKTLVIDTKNYKVALDPKGAKITSFFIKKYKVDLINKKFPNYPFELYTLNKSFDELINNMDFICKKEVKEKVTSVKCVTLVGNKTYYKKFTFNPDYTINFETNLKQAYVLFPQLPKNLNENRGHLGPILKIDKKVLRIDPEDIKGLEKYFFVHWGGQDSKYFLLALNPLSDTTDAIVGKHKTFSYVLEKPKNNSIVFAGPKFYTLLEKYNMEEAIDFGFFGGLAKLLLKFFLFLHKYIPDWGLSIIIFTILIRILLTPLVYKSYVGMKNMQKLAPKIQEIQKKYSSDPMKMQQEMIKVYKEIGANPMSGCLPILLQIPIFFALYELFYNAVELKGARFLWIPDLASKDPYFILPILFGLSMLFSSKLMPGMGQSQQDQMSKNINYIMAFVFTLLFATFPAGLVLYWVVNNYVNILQNILIEKFLEAKEKKKLS